MRSVSGYTYNKVFNSPSIPIGRRRGGVIHNKYDDPQADIEALKEVVGSKRARDITRKNRFMSQAAFDKWNAQETGGNGKYWGGYEDIDDDGVEEFIVRRGGKGGRLVALNGYTTKASDWVIRRPYYEKYPEIGSRPEGGIGRYAKDELYQIETDEYGYPTEESLERVNSARRQNPKYTHHVGTISPYNLFVKQIMSLGLEHELNELGITEDANRKELINELNQHYNKGWLLKLAGVLWKAWIKKPIMDTLEEDGILREWILVYNQNHATSARDDPEKFEKWLFNKPAIKKEVKEYTKELLKSGSDAFLEAVAAVAVEIDGMIKAALGRTSPPNSPSKQRLAALKHEPAEK